jgi:hypothetical protein
MAAENSGSAGAVPEQLGVASLAAPVSLLTPVLRASRRMSYRAGLQTPWQGLAHREVWSSSPLARIDRSGKTLFQLSGVARSGTTLLSGLMDQQPDVICLAEPFRSWFLRGSSLYGGGEWTRHPSRLVEELCRVRPETCIGFKETFYTADHRHGLANEHFFRRNAAAGVLTVAIVRDPRDVYASVEASVGSRAAVPEQFTATWIAFARWARDAAACLVTYEELATSPTDVMERVCGALGTEFHAQEVSVAPRSGEGDSRALRGGAVSTDSIGRFAERLDAAKVAQIEGACGEVMASFGYTSGTG